MRYQYVLSMFILDKFPIKYHCDCVGILVDSSTVYVPSLILSAFVIQSTNHQSGNTGVSHH